MKTLALTVLMSLATTSAFAAIKTEAVEYKEGDQTLEGYLAYPDNVKKGAPGVIIVHEWMGLGDYVKMRADQVAKLGYVAFAVDIYGKGVRPKDQKEAAEFATKYRSGDRALLRARAKAGLDALVKTGKVGADKIVAMGYCFGGTTALELARSGANLKGIVSFHGNLSTPNPADAKNIKGRVLALHGADDPFVPAEEVAAFEKEMRDAKLDWSLVAYGNSVHGFTQKQAGTDNSKGMAYNEKADKRSWEELRTFLADVNK